MKLVIWIEKIKVSDSERWTSPQVKPTVIGLRVVPPWSVDWLKRSRFLCGSVLSVGVWSVYFFISEGSQYLFAIELYIIAGGFIVNLFASCWGLRNVDTVRSLKDVVSKFQPCLVFICETKKKKKYVEKLQRSNKFCQGFYVDPTGIAGGLALWWTEEVKVTILNYCKNYIDVSITYRNSEEWYCTFIYAPPYHDEKKEFWEEIAGLRGQQGCKWCVIGDSNSIVNQGEKSEGNAVNGRNARWYLNFIETTSMIEMPIKGGSFTWSNQRIEGNAISEKLDRILFTGEWSFMYPKAIGVMEAATKSDHNPILLLLNGPRKKRKKVFKFESKWLLEEDCYDNIKEAWSLDIEVPRSLSSSQFGKKLRTTRIKLGRWSKEKYGKNRMTSEEIKQKLLVLQNEPLTAESKDQINVLKLSLQKVWESEERHWHQRARKQNKILKSSVAYTKAIHGLNSSNRDSIRCGWLWSMIRTSLWILQEDEEVAMRMCFSGFCADFRSHLKLSDKAEVEANSIAANRFNRVFEVVDLRLLKEIKKSSLEWDRRCFERLYTRDGRCRKDIVMHGVCSWLKTDPIRSDFKPGTLVCMHALHVS
ncbi:hypothetical protein V6N11_056778 [Hibiscus sabdariffa]|uniref:Endonuclease/exonuclease/phosphatase domain-containing protein n=1 Tax=Hibiscus sabdariffa TaxID=183260 RepID=A0ABR2T4U9_9ROSI